MSQQHPEPADDDARERAAAERIRHEQAAEALKLATFDELLDELTRRYPENIFVYAKLPPSGSGKRGYDVAYAGGLHGALGLAHYAAAEFGWKMLHLEDAEPGESDEDE